MAIKAAFSRSIICGGSPNKASRDATVSDDAPLKYGVPAPYVINAAMLDVSEYKFAVDNRYYFFEALLADRKHLILPTQYFEEDFADTVEVVARQLLDVLWQCFGLTGCTYYNSEGEWIAH